MKKLLLLVALASVVFAQHRTGPYDCTMNYSSSTITSSGLTALLASTQQTIRICSITIYVVQPASPANFGITAGSGTACASNQTSTTPLFTGVASAIQSYTLAVPNGSAVFAGQNVGLCLNLSATVTAAQVQVLYDLY